MRQAAKPSSCPGEFARYTFLSVLGTLGISCYILADTFFVSKMLGIRGLTALNLAIPLYNLIHGTGLMLGMGGATKFSVCKSQGKKEEGSRIYTNTLYLAFMFSAFFLLSGLFFSEKLALLLGADATVLNMTATYLKWLLIFAPGFILNDVFLCFVRNDEAPQLTMLAMLTGSFSNILLDYLFLFPLQMGIFGAVLATGLSPFISIVMMLPHWCKKKNTFHLIKTGLQTEIVRQDLSLGFPSFIGQLSSCIVMILFNALFLRLAGNTAVAAYGVIANLALVVMAVFTGIGQGVQPLISSYYGAGNKPQEKAMLRYSMLTMQALSLLLYLLIFVLARPITAVFNSEKDPVLQQLAVTGLKLYFLSMPFAGYNILATYLTSVERALPAHILSILRGLILIAPMAFLLASLGGMTGIWLAYPVTEALTAALGYVFYRHQRD